MLILTILFAALLPTETTLDSTDLRIEEVTVTATAHHHQQTLSSQSNVSMNAEQLQQTLETSLSKSLASKAGVQSSGIGSAQSRPMIRGMGQNRLAVIHDGIRHEGQQWGDDHGLEIDQFAIDRIEILKGPAALLYGSDAIGGAIVLTSSRRPVKPFAGKARLFTRSNNLLIGASLRLEGKRNKFFWRVNGTYQDYADCSVPTDSIEYYSYRIPLYKRTLRNTAGREADGSLTLGYAGYRFHTCLKIFETYAESGFFANAHGLEVRLSKTDYDRSRRDIDLPRQSVNHLKILSHTVYTMDTWDLEANLAWQHNLRKELSEPVSHGYMPKPQNSLERQFEKHTASINLKAHWHVHERHILRFGLNGEMQHNRRNGWGFIIPDFQTYTAGLFASEQWQVNHDLSLNAGIRYDYTHTDIRPYTDWYQTPVDGIQQYKQRSEELHRNYHSLTWSAGLSYTPQHWIVKANIGKGFRVPIAKELGADGINYHIFRYEQGNAALSPEESYQLDMTVGWHNRYISIKAEPFLSWSPNYIYLSPTADYHEGLQVYQYTQAKVLRTGFEAEVTVQPWKHIEINLQGDYVFARQMSGNKRGYGLPFSPPWRLMPEVRFLWDVRKKINGSGHFAVNVRVAGAQHDIVPPEKPTDGWWTLNLNAGQKFELDKCAISLTLSADNILNKKYYDHTSFYRLINVPEAGWNLSLMLGVDF